MNSTQSNGSYTPPAIKVVSDSSRVVLQPAKEDVYNVESSGIQVGCVAFLFDTASTDGGITFAASSPWVTSPDVPKAPLGVLVSLNKADLDSVRDAISFLEATKNAMESERRSTIYPQ